MGDLRHAFDVFAPIHTLWWTVFGQSLTWGLSSLYHWFSSVGALQVIGPYGLAVIALTLIIKLVLSPLFQTQIVLQRRALAQQRTLAPELAEIKRKYKGDTQKQQQATMELYRERGVNPLSSLSGCLPLLVQYPILIALYWVFLGVAQHHTFGIVHFLWIENLNKSPLTHHYPGVPIPTIGYLVIPVLAAATTFVQSKMMQQPKNPFATEQEQQQQQMQQTMLLMMPLFFGYITLVTPLGLGLYWFVSNSVSIIQQYFVTGWGGLRPGAQAAALPAGGAAPARSGGPLSGSVALNNNRPPTRPATNGRRQPSRNKRKASRR